MAIPRAGGTNDPPVVEERDPFQRGRTARDRRLDLFDRLAARLITLGGASIVLAVIAIVAFIGAGALPLLRGASVAPVDGEPREIAHTPLVIAVDEYQENLLIVDSRGTACVLHLQGPGAGATTMLDFDLAGTTLTAAALDFGASLVAVGDDLGRIHLFDFDWQIRYSDSGRQVIAAVGTPRVIGLFDAGASIARLAVARGESGTQTVVAQDRQGNLRTWFFDPEWDSEETAQLEPLEAGAPADFLTGLTLSRDGRRLAAGTKDGRVAVFSMDESGRPERSGAFPASDDPVTALVFLLGDQSLVTGDAAGRIVQWLPIRGERGSSARYVSAREFASHPATVQLLRPSPRDKGFLSVDTRGGIRLSHATAHRTYAEIGDSSGSLAALTFAPKANGIVAVARDGRILHWNLDNPYPEATLRTLFGKVWYEGYSAPAFVWQSTGGSDEFEPKLSLMPLIFGTLKGTFYAMLFSVPIAILAAIYVSQLARPGLRTMVKPALELMAAIPSVVVGFLAALWLAPIVERNLIATVLILVFVPLFAVFASLLWRAVPAGVRHRLPDGVELAVALPFILLGGWLAVTLGPHIERIFFAGDVTQWLFSSHGIRYDQRNNIVVGLAMGFAVIPIIFTVSEDALSNVPHSLVSGALALGASRWQATWRIVLRAASPGIFAAILLGLGRAVGETMIVLMATGNTPIMDWSIFNGMRTMSAAIAVEIPEAPQGGTLYRVLFGTAFLLFGFTLMLNAIAGVVGTRLRRRYGRF